MFWVRPVKQIQVWSTKNRVLYQQIVGDSMIPTIHEQSMGHHQPFRGVSHGGTYRKWLQFLWKTGWGRQEAEYSSHAAAAEPALETHPRGKPYRGSFCWFPWKCMEHHRRFCQFPKSGPGSAFALLHVCPPSWHDTFAHNVVNRSKTCNRCTNHPSTRQFLVNRLWCIKPGLPFVYSYYIIVSPDRV